MNHYSLMLTIIKTIIIDISNNNYFKKYLKLKFLKMLK